MKRLRQACNRYLNHADPLTEAGNLLAFVVGTNQPFYPVYLALIVGDGAWRGLPLLGSMPFFLAVPLLARRAPLAARALLVLTGIANTALAIAMMGAQAGLAALFAPCAAIAAALFRAQERWAMLALVALAIAAWLLTEGTGPDVFTPGQYAALQRLNAITAIGLCGVVGVAVSSAWRRSEGR